MPCRLLAVQCIVYIYYIGCSNVHTVNHTINFYHHRLNATMVANHRGAWGGLASPEILLGGLAMDPAPQKNQILAPPLFLI